MSKPIPVFLDLNSREIIYSDIPDDYSHLTGAYWLPTLGYRLKEFDGHIYLSGATDSGKSYYIQRMILNDKKHRTPIVFTDLDKKDETWDKMDYITFEGNKEHSKYNWEWLAHNDSNKILIFDDCEDNKELTKYRDKMLKEGRHKNTIVLCVNHRLQDWFKTTVPLNECAYIVTFPCSNKGHVFRFLKNEFGMDPKQIRSVLEVACREGRHLTIHKKYPQMIASTESIWKL